jgi:hypothetical protein
MRLSIQLIDCIHLYYKMWTVNKGRRARGRRLVKCFLDKRLFYNASVSSKDPSCILSGITQVILGRI